MENELSAWWMVWWVSNKLFEEKFETGFVKQDFRDERSIRETLAFGWDLLRILPHHELTRVSEKEIAEYL